MPDSVVTALKEYPIALALLVVIWWLFKRLKERDASVNTAWQETQKITDTINDLAVSIGELSALIHVCCTGDKPKLKDKAKSR